MKPVKLIGMYAHRPFYLTTEEYEQVQRALMLRAVVGDIDLGDQILLQLLEDNVYRYDEICLERLCGAREEKKS